jgi:hypothetical protein
MPTPLGCPPFMGSVKVLVVAPPAAVHAFASHRLTAHSSSTPHEAQRDSLTRKPTQPAAAAFPTAKGARRRSTLTNVRAPVVRPQ